MGSAHVPSSHWPALDVSTKRTRLAHSLRVLPGSLTDLGAASSEGSAALASLWRRDPSLWTDEASVQATIANRLGWLSSPALMAEAIGRLSAFADAVKRDGFTRAVLLGMGGSSLAPEVLRAILGVGPDGLQFQILDSTDPAAVRAAATPPARTLYVLASKSGTTIEPNALAAHFQERLQAGGRPWARHFVAITDEGTELASRARTEGFRDLFINPSDIGGRYSAVSYFGLVPAALMGHDVAALVGWSLGMLSAAGPESGSVLTNPAAALGVLIGAAARAGRDKLTLLLPASLAPLGLWIEQLIAESTGKSGMGVVPVTGEPIAPPDRYGSDRFFVRVGLSGSAEGAPDSLGHALVAAGSPVVDIEMPERSALGAEFVRWEIATAIAGALLRINPFDEPNVQQAKDATRTLLDRYAATGRLRGASKVSELPEGVTVEGTGAAHTALGGRELKDILTVLDRRDYLAILAYVGPDEGIAKAFGTFRTAVRNRVPVATTVGYGPRYLHSTGQLHKGGPNTGVFVLLTAEPVEDVPIPGATFSFGTLELAQALGDYASLDASGRRAVHIHLPRPDARLLRDVLDRLLECLPEHS